MPIYEFQTSRPLYVYSTYGATYPMHFHTHCEIMYVTQYDVCVTVDGTTFTANKDDVIFVAPHQIHSFESGAPLVYIMFAGLPLFSEYAERMNECQPASPIVHFSTPEERDICLSLMKFLSLQFHDAHYYGDKSDKPVSAPVASAMAKTVIAILMEHLTWKRSQSSDPDLLRRILEYCLKHYKSDISVHSVAEALELSDCAVTRTFATSFHCNFRQYINSLRIDEATDKLISGEMSITEAALTSGFDTLRTFNRAFLVEKGITPSEYRKNYMQNKILAKNS